MYILSHRIYDILAFPTVSALCPRTLISLSPSVQGLYKDRNPSRVHVLLDSYWWELRTTLNNEKDKLGKRWAEIDSYVAIYIYIYNKYRERVKALA